MIASYVQSEQNKISPNKAQAASLFMNEEQTNTGTDGISIF
jgi:hypothetical protein